MPLRLLSLLLLSACSRPAAQPEPSPRAPSLTQALDENAAVRTALLTLELHPDGSAQLTGLVVKPFAFRRHHLVEKPEGEGALRLEVREGNSPPLLVPLDLGAPGEGRGDVRDRWEGETVILRAPYLGADTRYALVRDTATGPQQLTTWEAR